MEDIVTKDKEQFFLSEMKHFRKRSLERFKKMMEGDDATCKTCGVYYWKGCKKRCECDS
jgi:predicted Zn-ribbon and HTH transcriptional regulator